MQHGYATATPQHNPTRRTIEKPFDCTLLLIALLPVARVSERGETLLRYGPNVVL